jgi:hypothetical protein
VLLLDLDLANVAGMLNNLRDVRLVSSSNLAGDTLSQVRESTVHPVLPEDTNAVAERRKVGRDHAEGAVDRPEEEEDNEKVMGVPEALKVLPACLLRRCERNRHQSNQHNVAAPSRAGSKVGQDETHEPEVVRCGELGQVVPMCDCVNPGEEYDGPGDQLVESNVLVERDDVVQRRATSHRYQVSANREENEGYVDV